MEDDPDAFGGLGLLKQASHVVHALGVDFVGGEAAPLSDLGSRRLGIDVELRNTPRVRNDITVARDDTDTRVVLAVVGAAALGLPWVALINLMRVVETAVNGDPFAASNPARLRQLSVLAITVPAVSVVGSAVLDQTLDVVPTYRVVTPGPGWPTALGVGVVLLSLAEVLRVGTGTRELESFTA